MATKLEECEDTKIVRKSIVAQGGATFDEEDKSEYETNFESFALKINKALCERYSEEIASRECLINFFPMLRDDVDNLMREQNTSYMGESVISPLFWCVSNNKMELVNCKKMREKIPSLIMFMILC